MNKETSQKIYQNLLNFSLSSLKNQFENHQILDFPVAFIIAYQMTDHSYFVNL